MNQNTSPDGQTIVSTAATAPAPPFVGYSTDLAGTPTANKVERETRTMWVCVDGTRWNKRTREMVGVDSRWRTRHIVVPGDSSYERHRELYRAYYHRTQANHWLEIARREREDERALEAARNAVSFLETLARNKTPTEPATPAAHPRTKETP